MYLLCYGYIKTIRGHSVRFLRPLLSAEKDLVGDRSSSGKILLWLQNFRKVNLNVRYFTRVICGLNRGSVRLLSDVLC